MLLVVMFTSLVLIAVLMPSDNWETDVAERTKFVPDCFCSFSDESVFIMAATNICSSKTLEAVQGQEFSDNIERSRDDLAKLSKIHVGSVLFSPAATLNCL